MTLDLIKKKQEGNRTNICGLNFLHNKCLGSEKNVNHLDFRYVILFGKLIRLTVLKTVTIKSSCSAVYVRQKENAVFRHDYELKSGGSIYYSGIVTLDNDILYRPEM